MPQQLTKEGMVPIKPGSTVGLWVRRYGWVGYWLTFSGYSLTAARNPGFVMDPPSVPYPWAAAFLTCALLGVQTAALNAILRPLSATRSWRRVATASGLALLFAALSLVTTVTDMPGYYYAPGLFALANVVVVPLVGTVLTLFAPRKNEKASSV
jgi:hypothetical protein